MIKREATCGCGQLMIVCTGEPTRVSMCHCFACQHRTGSTFGGQAWFPRDAVSINHGVGKLGRVGFLVVDKPEPPLARKQYRRQLSTLTSRCPC